MLVAPGMTPGLARGTQHNEDRAISGANTTLPALAPWFIDTVDAPHDVGQYVSMALDPGDETAYISYYGHDLR